MENIKFFFAFVVVWLYLFDISVLFDFLIEQSKNRMSI